MNVRGEGCPIIRWRLVYETSRLLSLLPNRSIRIRYTVGSTDFFSRETCPWSFTRKSHTRILRESRRRDEEKRDARNWMGGDGTSMEWERERGGIEKFLKYHGSWNALALHSYSVSFLPRALHRCFSLYANEKKLNNYLTKTSQLDKNI